MLKISTICSAYNSFEKIDLLINSFLSQQYNNKELLVIDGSKNIKQSQLLKNKFKNYKNIKIYHLKNSSIYKCLNFGIKKSSGQVLNIMGDDDTYSNNKIFKIISKAFQKKIDFVYGNTVYKKNEKLIRYYKSYDLKKKLINIGYIPSHTSLFVKKKIYKMLGLYNENYLIASDFEFFLKLYENKKLKYKYLNKTITKMSIGGASNKSLSNIAKSNFESYLILKKNNYKFASVRIITKIILKVILKFYYNPYIK